MHRAQAAELQKLEHGDISSILKTALENAVDIQAPVFFANGGGPQSALSSSSAHSPQRLCIICNF
jgi:hypothetical protein